jgi:hypothetical protein
MEKLSFAMITAAAVLHAQGLQQSVVASGITSVIAAINKALTKPEVSNLATLFASDGDLRIDGKVLVRPKAIAEGLANRPAWSEVTPARIKHESVRLITSDVAMVDANWVQYGSTIVKRAQPVMLLLKKDGKEWRVVSLRLGSWRFADIP